MMDLLNDLPTLKELERAAIIVRLTANKNKTEVAKSLGITVKTLYNKLEEYGLSSDYVKSKRGEK